ncbi:MAG: PfkB family carbohydrate kinase [Alphaproteobacteria bacterium]
MAVIAVAANAHLDRVWRLAAPLRVGGRNVRTAVETRLGGGGFNTGSVLLALGHRVRLVATLADDAAGHARHAALAARGFDVDHVTMVSGETVPLEILLDPAGDRTIVSPADQPPAPTALPMAGVDLAYVNLRSAPGAPDVVRAHAARIVAQLPLRPGERRPARILIASRSDMGDDDTAIMAHARASAGDAVEAVVVTAGAGPITVLSAGPPRRIPVEPLADATDTTGAGDFLAAGLLDGLAGGATIADAAAHGAEIARRVLADRSRFVDDRL